jgi:uncharacterized protein YdaU (DUF1376 family)
MDTPTYMQWYPGDYLAATGHLSTVEHGAYCLLLMAYWVNNGPLKDDNGRLARTVRMSLQEWLEIKDTIAEFFDVVDGQWRHYRLDDDLQSFYARLEQTRNAGRKSALKRWGNKKVTDVTTDAITVVTNPLQRKSNASSSSSTPSSSSSSNISFNPYNPLVGDKQMLEQDEANASENQASATTVYSLTLQPESKPEPKSKKSTKPDIDLPEWIDSEAWQGFLDHRKGLRKPLNTPRAITLLINKLTEYKEQGHNPNALLDLAVERGWQSVYVPDNNKGSNRQSSQPKQNMYGMGMITDMSKVPDEDCITPYDVDYEVERRQDESKVQVAGSD